jgi:hypothetical protein
MLSVFMLSVVMLSVIKLSVVVLSVVVPILTTCLHISQKLAKQMLILFI